MASKLTLTHRNSKIITLFRNGKAIHDAQTKGDKEVQEYIALGQEVLGSFFESSASNRIGTGLTEREIQLLMPAVIDIGPLDNNFRKEVKRYFQEKRVKIPYGTGLKLEVGLEEDNTQEVSASNLPLNIADYITYRFALAHPHTAISQDEARGRRNKWFYIYDKEAVIAAKQESLDYADEALKIYLRIKNDSWRVDAMLTLMGVDITVYNKSGLSDANINTEKVSELKRLSNIKAKEFHDAYTHKHFEEKFWLGLMLNTKVLRKVGNTIMDKQSNIIGRSEEEAVLWMKDPKNSNSVTIFKAEVQGAVKMAKKEEAVQEAAPVSTKTEEKAQGAVKE